MINLLSHRLSGASTSDRCHDRPSSSLHLDQLISEDGTVTIEQPIMPVEEATIQHFLLSHLHLLPGQDKPAPSGPISAVPWFVASCGVRLSEVETVCFSRAEKSGPPGLHGGFFTFYWSAAARILY